MTDGNKNNKYGSFPDPFVSPEVKVSNKYGLLFAKAINSQWGTARTRHPCSAVVCTISTRARLCEWYSGHVYLQTNPELSRPEQRGRDTTQLDWSPVPIVPKFVKVVVNRILSRKPYPSVEALDPVSKNEKDMARATVESSIKDKELLQQAKQLGLQPKIDPDDLPDTTEEAEIFMEQNMKTNAEIAAQLGTALTLDWNDFDQNTYRRCVEDLVVCGMAVAKRDNDPNYGITTKYIDPAMFLHSYTEDPNMSDIVYGAYIQRISIQELKRQAGDQIPEKEYEKLAKSVKNKSYNNANAFNYKAYDQTRQKYAFGYDDYLVDIMEFEFVSLTACTTRVRTASTATLDSTSRALSTRCPQAPSTTERRTRWSIRPCTADATSWALIWCTTTG